MAGQIMPNRGSVVEYKIDSRLSGRFFLAVQAYLAESSWNFEIGNTIGVVKDKRRMIKIEVAIINRTKRDRTMETAAANYFDKTTHRMLGVLTIFGPISLEKLF